MSTDEFRNIVDAIVFTVAVPIRNGVFFNGAYVLSYVFKQIEFRNMHHNLHDRKLTKSNHENIIMIGNFKNTIVLLDRGGYIFENTIRRDQK